MVNDTILAGAGIIIFKNTSVLLVKHNEKAGHITDTYGLPAGKIDEGEDEKTAAVRELFEETGLTTRVDYLQEYPNNFYTADILRKEGMRKSSLRVFICTKYTGSLLGRQETTPEWISLDELDNYNLLPNVKKAILAAKEFLNNVKS